MYKAPRISHGRGSLRNQKEDSASDPSSTSSLRERFTSSVVSSPSSATTRNTNVPGAYRSRDPDADSYRRMSYDPSNHDLEMEEETTYTMPDTHRLVIAIDYGTTFTGVGFATPSLDGSKVSLEKDIYLVRNWGSGMTNDVKVPSVYSYSRPTAEKEQQFGASLSPDALAMVNTKLELDLQETRSDELDLIIQVLDGMKDLHFDHIKASKGYPAYTWKKPEEIATDYLTKVYHHFCNATVSLEEIKKTAPVDIIITVPVNWSYRARNSTLKAVRNAGFNDSNFPRLNKYIMVTEPEAAAIYTARYLQENDQHYLKKKECFITVDAGGGTVDVVGYKVRSLIPGLEIDQVTIPTGAKCGSSFINENFKKWLRHILKRDYKKLDPESDGDKISAHAMEGGAMRKVMTKFEAHKKAFTPESPDMHIDLPEPLHKLTIPGRVDEGDLTISNRTMRSFFDPHVERVIELIQGQINQVEDKRNRVRAIFLIGGFSESEYLQAELKESMDLRNVLLHRPGPSWSAVINGAVLYGIELAPQEEAKVMIPCPRNYGVKLNNPYSKRLHDSRDKFINQVNGEAMVGEQLTWLIRKGDLLQTEAGEGHVIEQELLGAFRQGGPRSFDMPIYEYPDDDVPDRFQTAHEEVKQVATLTADFTEFPLERFDRHINVETGVTWYQVKFTCRLRVKGMNIIGEMWWYDQLMHSVTIENIHMPSVED